MMPVTPALLKAACEKAELAYGDPVRRSLAQAVEALRKRPHRLEACMKALGMVTVSKAQLWQRMRKLQRVLAAPGVPHPRALPGGERE